LLVVSGTAFSSVKFRASLDKYSADLA